MMRRQRKGERGYTVVEVMSAMTLIAIGAAGVIGMQRVTIQGGMDARNFDVATNIAREWQSRLQRDAALNWTAPNALTPARRGCMRLRNHGRASFNRYAGQSAAVNGSIGSSAPTCGGTMR